MLSSSCLTASNPKSPVCRTSASHASCRAKPRGQLSSLLNGSRRGDLDLRLRRAGSGTQTLDFLHKFQTGSNLAEDDVGTIEPRGDNGGDEELGAVGVLSGVSHGEDTGLGVLERKVLISELLAVDGLSASSVAAGEVTTLQHEVGDYAVELGARETETVLAGGELTEVPCGFGNHIVEQLEGDTTGGCAVDGDVELFTQSVHNGMCKPLISVDHTKNADKKREWWRLCWGGVVAAG